MTAVLPSRSIVSSDKLCFYHVLIQSDSKQVQWTDWFAANGLTAPPSNGSRFDRSFLAISAAAEGPGIALESTRLAERELASGRLATPLKEAAKSIRYVGHNLVFPRYVRQPHPLKAFSDWLQAELLGGTHQNKPLNSSKRRRGDRSPECLLRGGHGREIHLPDQYDRRE
jgi:DNA-binding transcriptional LysR family regulator